MSTKANLSGSSSHKKITKAIIPIAGKGTRFLPATKVIPKEVIPIINMPMIYYVVKEAVEAGLDRIIFVTSRGKNSVAEVFDRHQELETFLEKKGDEKNLKLLKDISELTKIITVSQKEQLGLGHAILQAEDLIDEGERFAVLLGDDIILNPEPAIKQLMNVSDTYNGASVIGVMEVPKDEVHKYGIVGGDFVNSEKSTMKMKMMIEKPTMDKAPSQLATPGRYILNSKIFKYLNTIPRGRGGEYQLTDAIDLMIKDHDFYAHKFVGDRFDTGQPSGYLDAVVDFALKDPIYRDDMLVIIKNKLQKYGLKA